LVTNTAARLSKPSLLVKKTSKDTAIYEKIKLTLGFCRDLPSDATCSCRQKHLHVQSLESASPFRRIEKRGTVSLFPVFGYAGEEM